MNIIKYIDIEVEIEIEIEIERDRVRDRDIERERDRDEIEIEIEIDRCIFTQGGLGQIPACPKSRDAWIKTTCYHVLPGHYKHALFRLH